MQELYMENGMIIQIVDKMEDVCVEVARITSTMGVLVIEGFYIDMLMGMNMLRKLSINIDFKCATMTISMTELRKI